MSAEIERLKPLLEASRLEALEVQKSVVADRSAAREYKETVERERAASAANSERMLRLAGVCVVSFGNLLPYGLYYSDLVTCAEETDRELQKVLPELDAATQSLRLLKRSDLDLLRAMARPPHGVRLTLEAG